MTIGNYVFVIKPDDPFYGQKFIIRAVATDFSGKITGYTLHPYHANGNEGAYRDYAPEDVQYTTRRRTKVTSQMQLL